MTALKWIVGLAIGIFAIFFVAGIVAPSSPDLERAQEVLRVVNERCDTMMSDAALGSERRATRESCDQLKEVAQRKVNDERSKAQHQQ
jgi:hypothetical protein